MSILVSVLILLAILFFMYAYVLFAVIVGRWLRRNRYVRERLGEW